MKLNRILILLFCSSLLINCLGNIRFVKNDHTMEDDYDDNNDDDADSGSGASS